MIVLGVVLGLGLSLVVVARRRRKSVLAGLDATRPVFSIDPPSRRVANRKHEAL